VNEQHHVILFRGCPGLDDGMDDGMDGFGSVVGSHIYVVLK
jgi:hypothetical protein